MRFFNHSSNNAEHNFSQNESLFEIRLRINQELILKIIPWFFTVLVGGTGTYAFSNFISSPTESSTYNQFQENSTSLPLIEKE